MSESTQDYTAHTGPLEETELHRLYQPIWRMFSFTRPASHFWNGVANYLHDQGMTDDEIGERLMSKDMRWMLDHGSICDIHLDKLGYQAAATYYEQRAVT